MKFNFSSLQKYLVKPELFAPSIGSLWDDEHISKGMLEAHLNPHIDGASRTPEFIDASVKWLLSLSKISPQATVLDLGCGPGLYTERLAKAGLDVTGVDFSRRSIKYAKAQAEEQGLPIEYVYQNYLTIDYEDQFDLVIMIYCDLEALTNDERDLLLSKVYRALKPGGLFIFDVFTPAKYSSGQFGQNNWDYEEAGFWRPHPHLCLNAHYYYPEEDVHLDQTVLLEEGEQISVYRVWDHIYTEESIEPVLKRGGFTKMDYYADVAGDLDHENSQTLCVVAQK